MMRPIDNATLPTEGLRSFGFQRSATHTHQGIDLPAREGVPVLAVAPGVVRHATHEWQQGFSGYGRVVVVEHPELGAWTLYAHLSEVLVAPGEVVSAGEMLGRVGRTAFTHEDHTAEFQTSGAHLHFEVSPRPYPQDSEAPRLNPVAWLEALEPAWEPSDPFVSAPHHAGAEPSLQGLSFSLSSEQPPSSAQPHGGPVHCGSRDCLQHPAGLCGCDCTDCLAALEAETSPTQKTAVPK
jgi:hypothetical protein